MGVIYGSGRMRSARPFFGWGIYAAPVPSPPHTLPGKNAPSVAQYLNTNNNIYIYHLRVTYNIIILYYIIIHHPEWRARTHPNLPNTKRFSWRPQHFYHTNAAAAAAA